MTLASHGGGASESTRSSSASTEGASPPSGSLTGRIRAFTTLAAARAAWARLIRKVYEAHPLVCPHCGGEMRFLSVIEEPPVIERILRQLKL